MRILPGTLLLDASGLEVQPRSTVRRDIPACPDPAWTKGEAFAGGTIAEREASWVEQDIARRLP
jgi:hypothetical protein